MATRSKSRRAKPMPTPFDAAWERFERRLLGMGLDPHNAYLPADDPRSDELRKALRQYHRELDQLRPPSEPHLMLLRPTSATRCLFFSRFGTRGTLLRTRGRAFGGSMPSCDG